MTNAARDFRGIDDATGDPMVQADIAVIGELRLIDFIWFSASLNSLSDRPTEPY